MEKSNDQPKLNLRQPKHLAAMMKVSLDELSEALAEPESHYQEFILHDPNKPAKPRIVISARNPLRRLQSRFYNRVLLPKLHPSPYSHGGVRGRSVKSNVLPHGENFFVYKTDIANFYPSVHSSRVYRLFCESLGCSPDVARLCTRLCTFRHHLALGLITSPILADQILKSADIRIAGAVKKLGLTYTRFVDDITITARFDLSDSGVPSVVREILKSCGFKIQKSKDVFGELQKVPMTGIRIRKSGRLDVAAEYLRELLRILDDAKCLARGETFQGPFYRRSQVLGKIQFCCWVNPSRKSMLLKRFKRVDWKQCHMEAERLKLCVHKTQLTPRTSQERIE